MKCSGGAWVVTKFPDGTEVHAHPQHGDEDIQRAEDLGYDGSVGGMTFDHDRLHNILSWALGVEGSPSLWAVAHPEDDIPGDVRGAEEAMVMAAQKYLNLVKQWRG